MEDWKLQTAINEFTEALDVAGHSMVGATKRMKKTYDELRDWKQQRNVLEQVMPYLDDNRAAVRQLAACVVMGMPVERFSAMPPSLDIELRDSAGAVRHRVQWENKVPDKEQQPEWMMFVARHQMYLEDKKREARR